MLVHLYFQAGCDQPPEGVTPQLTEGIEDEFTPVDCTDTGTLHQTSAGEPLVTTPLPEHLPNMKQSNVTELNTAQTHTPWQLDEFAQPTDANISHRYTLRQTKSLDRLL